MTRLRCDPKTGIPSDLHAKYYSSRASAGLIFTEASPIDSRQTLGGAGLIETKEQIAGWKKVVDAVHEKGGRIFLQLWHGGRTIDTSKTSAPVISPSAIAVKSFDKEGKIVEGPTPVEMTHENIKTVIQQFQRAATNAKAAGFDGIEVQGASGYLVDSFLKDFTNQRTDEYGGSVEKRARFVLELIDALIEVFGAGRVGIKLSPVGRANDTYDSNPIETYTYLLTQLNERKISHVQLVEPTEDYGGRSLYPKASHQIPTVCKQFREVFKGTLITNSGYNPDTALKAIQEGYADLVAFAKLYVGNPDLVERVKNGWELAQPDFTTLLSPGEKGYIDYPTYQEKPKKN
jgi:2,4-dienoyl-CoA reductase-like NADH-dependent reductase (Old Yellow Enzyme family)